jgi:putative flippase GtrA
VRVIATEARRFALYVASGFAATGTHYAVMVALVSGAGYSEIFGTCAGFVAGACVKYPLNYWAVFASGQRHHIAAVRFVLSLAVTFVLNAVILWVLLRTLDVHYMVSQVLTTGVVLFANYLMARYWVFHTREKGS